MWERGGQGRVRLREGGREEAKEQSFVSHAILLINDCVLELLDRSRLHQRFGGTSHLEPDLGYTFNIGRRVTNVYFS